MTAVEVFFNKDINKVDFDLKGSKYINEGFVKVNGLLVLYYIKSYIEKQKLEGKRIF